MRLTRRRGDAEVDVEVNEITGDILDAAVKIHKLFGPGLLESVYERLLKIELEKRGHTVQRQLPVSFIYEGVCFDNAFRIDLLVDGEVVLELKSVASMCPVFAKQLKTYLVLTGKRIGLLINFGMAMLKDGFHRVINSKMPDVSPESKIARLRLTDLDLTNLCDSASPREATSVPETQLCGSASPRELHFLSRSAPHLCGSASPREATSVPETQLCGSASPRETISVPEAQLCGSASPRIIS